MRIEIHEEAQALLPDQTEIHFVRHTVMLLTCDCDDEDCVVCPDCGTCHICCRCCPGEG